MSIIYDLLHKGGKSRRLFLTGHSLGAALAILTANRIFSEKDTLLDEAKDRTLAVAKALKMVCTFASPICGVEAYARAIDAQLSDIAFYRVVVEGDPVPQLLEAKTGFHPGTPVTLYTARKSAGKHSMLNSYLYAIEGLTYVPISVVDHLFSYLVNQAVERVYGKKNRFRELLKDFAEVLRAFTAQETLDFFRFLLSQREFCKKLTELIAKHHSELFGKEEGGVFYTKTNSLVALSSYGPLLHLINPDFRRASEERINDLSAYYMGIVMEREVIGRLIQLITKEITRESGISPEKIESAIDIHWASIMGSETMRERWALIEAADKLINDSRKVSALLKAVRSSGGDVTQVIRDVALALKPILEVSAGAGAAGHGSGGVALPVMATMAGEAGAGAAASSDRKA